MVKGEFILQWHIGEACNLRCKHCYQEHHQPVNLKYSELLKILNQYRTFLKKKHLKGHINLTGGEPLLNPYFYKLLDEFKKDKDLYTFCVLTNGTLINEEVAKKIASYNPLYVQVSIEGSKKTNDFIRGKGVLKKTLNAIKYLNKYGIYTSISFTANKLNYKDFPKVVRMGERVKVNRVWADRFIPLGDSSLLIMNKKEVEDFFKIMNKERLRLKKKKKITEVGMTRALQFLETGDTPYHCTAGDTLLTVMENGDLVPCRRLPIVCGNLLKKDLLKLYDNPILKKLREKQIPRDCKLCDYSKDCRGGLKCLNYALKGKTNIKDIDCYFE